RRNTRFSRDWSSDVCSSDLAPLPAPPLTFLDRLQVSFSQLAAVIPALFGALVILFAGYLLARLVQRGAERLFRRMQLNALLERRSEERRVGKGCRCGWAPAR